jgi:hypothetical protein
VRFLSDINFRHAIAVGLRKRVPQIDIVRGQDVRLEGASDPDLLEWAAIRGYILLTHDRSTMPRFAWDRIAAGKRMPGLIVVSNRNWERPSNRGSNGAGDMQR